MSGLSIRARLTTWFVTVLAIATVTLTVASWRMSSQSVVGAADLSLQARIEGVRRFLENPRTRLTVEGLQDEFGEYAELTRGEALLEVIGPSGVVLVQPAIPGWPGVPATVGSDNAAEFVAEDRPIGRLPFRVASSRIEVAGGSYRVTVAAPMAPAYDALAQFHRLQLIVLPFVLLVAGAGGYWISRRALAPVDRMTREVQAITVERLDRRVDEPAADDEVRRLATTFNAVLSRLQSAVGDIVRFTADASHELRTPVSLVRTTAELALRRDRSPTEYRAALAEVLEHTSRMSDLVDDLLLLARTDAGIEAQGVTTFELGAIAREACHEVSGRADQRRIELTVDAPTETLMVSGDRTSLRRLLLIVLDNAMKYSPDGGTVDVRVARDGDDHGSAALVSVSDSGIGLDVAEMPRLFERFYRGSRARQHAPDGNGLGLAIARTIAERYQWALHVAPAHPGSASGCRVDVRLPIDRASTAEAAVVGRAV